MTHRLSSTLWCCSGAHRASASPFACTPVVQKWKGINLSNTPSTSTCSQNFACQYIYVPGCFCSCPLTGDRTTSAPICKCVVNDVSAMKVFMLLNLIHWSGNTPGAVPRPAPTLISTWCLSSESSNSLSLFLMVDLASSSCRLVISQNEFTLSLSNWKKFRSSLSRSSSSRSRTTCSSSYHCKGVGRREIKCWNTHPCGFTASCVYMQSWISSSNVPVELEYCNTVSNLEISSNFGLVWWCGNTYYGLVQGCIICVS